MKKDEEGGRGEDKQEGEKKGVRNKFDASVIVFS